MTKEKEIEELKKEIKEKMEERENIFTEGLRLGGIVKTKKGFQYYKDLELEIYLLKAELKGFLAGQNSQKEEIEKLHKCSNCGNKKYLKFCPDCIGLEIIKAKNSQKEDELNWLETTFQDIRKVRTQVAGLSSFQMRIDNRIRMLNSEINKGKKNGNN